jgi:hypothetical protein
MNFLTLWGRNHKAQRLQDVKSRIVKNEEIVLEAMAKRAKGVKSCPFYLGSACISDACEFFLEFVTINSQTGQRMKYHQCVFVKTPLLMIELREEISKLVSIFYQTAKKETEKENK